MNKSFVFCLLSAGLAVASFAGSAKRLDVSQYFVSTNYLNCVAKRTALPTCINGVLAGTCGKRLDLAKPCAGGMTFGEGLTNVAARVAAMDAAGVDTALLGSFVQVWDLPEADAISIARESNNDVARAMKAYPGRFEGAALLPIVAGSDTCVDEAVAELNRCVSDLGFKVWIASSNFGADHLYDAKFEPLLKRAEQLGVAIYLKDAYPLEEPFAALDGEDDPNEWGLALSNGQDLMVTATLMVMNGTFDRYPTLRIVLPNLGEYLPFNLDRMSFMLSQFDDPENIPCEQTLFHYAVTNRNFILTTSGTTNEIPFACARRVMGADALCFGTGWPLGDMKAQVEAIAAFDLTDAERDGVWGLNAQKYVFRNNPMKYFRAEDAAAYSNCVHSLKNVQQGELYTMRWDDDADYHMDEMLESGCTNNFGMIEWLCANVLNDAPPPPPVTDLGCSAFAATNALGQRLAERNFDYRYRMTHALVYVPRSEKYHRPYASVSSVDCGWVGYDIGGLDNGTNDLSYAALFPHIPLDGMNEKGLMVTVLSLDARTNGCAMTEQYFPDRTNIVTTVAIRYLLDHADSTESGINMLTNNFNMFQAIGGDIPIAANYHFYLCDNSGDSRVVEWLPPTDGSRNWTPWVTNATSVSNFYFYDGYGHGSNRWEVMRHALAQQNDHLEVPDAMHLARAVAQHKGAEQTSWTHWSVVYNLSDLTAHIATLGNYDEIFPYRLDLEASSDWTTEAPKSARPAVETNLPPFEAATAQADKVYLLPDPISGSSGEPTSYAGASVAAVNRQGLTYDAVGETLHAVATNKATAKCRAVFYVDISPGAVTSIVAGVNEAGLAARMVKFRNSTGPGDVSPSETLMSVLNNGETFESAVSMMGSIVQSADGSGFILSDAKGNVAVWGPTGAELETDDASEMVRNSLDLRKGIYQIDGDGRGEFDELPGLMRLASSVDTKAIVSMGYGRLDVMMPESNLVWRIAVPDANVPAYGVIAEPKAVANATATLTYTNGSAVVMNNRGRLVAEANEMLRIVYAADPGCFFTDGAKSWTRDFSVGDTVTTPPAPESEPTCPRDPDYATADGKDWLFHHDIAAKRYEGEPAADPGVDLFYLYPTSVLVSDDRCVDGVCDIDDPYLRGPNGASNSWNQTAAVFGDFTRVYAPYYRQTPSDVEMPIGEQPNANAMMRQYWYERAPYVDVTNALVHYFTVINPNGERPFLFAGHSHGSGMLTLVMEHFFAEKPERKAWLRNMVACYAIGWGVSKDWEAKLNEDLDMYVATNATDAGVYVFWNTYGPNTNAIETILYPDPEKSAASVNPLLWTRVATNATADLNLGGWTTNASPNVIPHLYDASNHVANGTIICTSKDVESQYLVPVRRMFGEHSLHAWDYKLYWENLRLNAYQRIETATGRKPCCGTPTDYSASENWLSLPATADKGLDVFYLYPTCVPGSCTTLIGEIDDGMKANAQEEYERGPSTFESYANVYAPYYRQGSVLMIAADTSAAGTERFCSTHVMKTDVFAALDWYFANRNPGAVRPFVLASHSQGSANMKNVLEEYFVDKKKQYLDKMVAAYVLGWKITSAWCDKVGIPFATGADDTRVVMTWNAEGPGATSDNFLTDDPTQLAINPINWKRDVTEAPKADNLGSVITNAAGVLYETGAPGVTGAHLQDSRPGAVVVDAPETIPVGISPGFGSKSYHFEDFGFFRDNIGANGLNRFATITDQVFVDPYDFRVNHATFVVKTNGVQALCGPAGATVVAKGATAVAIYTVDVGYVFEDGKTTATVGLDTSVSPAKPLSALPKALSGFVITKPWLQDIYTNRVTVMCETLGEMRGLSVKVKGGDLFAMTPTNGLKEGTFVYKAQISLNPGKHPTYELVTNGVTIAGTEGAVMAWKDGDAAFTCAVWGDNQEGVQKYDWGNENAKERYRCITNMFVHMKQQKPDFGFSTGDFTSDALYDEELEPGELRGADDLFGRTIPYHLVWGNHDCIGTFLGEVYTNAAQRYFSPAATEDEGWFYVYRNDVLFVGVHWTWGKGDAETRYAAIVKGVEDLLKTDRAKNAKFRILVQHTPIFLECYNVLPKIDWFSDTRLLDVAKAGGVDLVFSGHTHAYERIERDGLVQVVNGGMGYLDHGERWYNNYGSDTKVGGHQNTPLLWARQSGSSPITSHSSLGPAEPVRMGCFQGYGMLSVEGDTLTYKAHAFNADGSYIGVADSFELESKVEGWKSGKVEGRNVKSIVNLNLQPQPDSPVNNATWKAYKDAQGEAWEKPAGAADTDPVVNVSKTEIECFCAALNAGTTGANYRLPTVDELAEIFGGDLKRDVSEWTRDVDPNSGWCRILGGNKVAVDYTWCREYDKPAMASADCHANYLGFRVIDKDDPVVRLTEMDKALAALAEIADPAEIYLWKPLSRKLVDITSDWTNGTLTTRCDYSAPVIFTGKGDLQYRVRREVTFGGGLAAPNATSLDLSHVLDLGPVSKPVTVKGEFRGGVAPDEWRFYLKCDELTLDNVTYRGQVFSAVTDSRALNLVGTNDFSGAVMSICVDKVLADPREDFVTNLVSDAAATLWLRRLDFSARGVVEEVLGRDTAGFMIGANVTLVTTEDVLFAIKGATLTVDGTLDAAGIDIAGHLLGLLPQEASVLGFGSVRTTHFGMCDKSTLYLGVPDVTLLSSVPYRTYSDPASGCNVKRVYRTPDYATADGRDWLFNHAIAGKECLDEAAADNGVDLFYVYPTLNNSAGMSVVNGFRDIDDAIMRSNVTETLETAVGNYYDTGRCFADMMHVYAPYYRQATIATAHDCATNAVGETVTNACANFLQCLYEGPAYADITNALDVYFAKWNNGRPLVLAAHSQGSAMLRLVMEHYFTRTENQAKAKQIICSYQLGFGIGKSSMETITEKTGIAFASDATGTNVIVSYNTVGEGATGNSLLLSPDTLAINPLSWTRTSVLADKNLNLGARTNELVRPEIVIPHLYSAQVVDGGENRGEVVVCKELNDKVLPPTIMGTHSLHGHDYAAFQEDLHKNCYDRITAATGRKPICGTPTDYAPAENWMSRPETADKPVDVFYLYPTCVPGSCKSLIGEIEDSMKASANEHYKRGPSTFESYANVYAPYYRQGSALALISDLSADGIQRFCSTHVVKTDVFAALDWYFANRNPGAARPFILASHSQGSANMKNVFEEYFVREKASYTNQLVAAYILGYKITPDWCEKVGVPFASREDDTRVVMTWNAEGPGETSDNFLTADPTQLAINPLNWRRDAVDASKADNLGSVITNATGVLYNTGKPGVTGTRLQTNRPGAVIVDAPETIPVGISPGFGTKSYHFEDWGFFHDNIGANGYVRYAALASEKSIRFARPSYSVLEGGAVSVRVNRGKTDTAVQATLTYVKNTGAFSAAYMDGKKVSFPLTLGWTKGDREPKEILFQTTASARASADRFFTLQLSAPVGETVSGLLDACTVTLLDAQGGEEPDPYVRALAYPANAGTVSGAGALASEKSYRTLAATAKNYATFAGWYRAKAGNPNEIDLTAPVEPYSARNPKQIRVGYGTDNGAGTYFAYFTNVLAVAAVVEPQAFDAGTGEPLPGVAGVRAAQDGTYTTYVGVKFALPVGITDDSDKGTLTVSKLPSGLSLKQDRETGAYRIEGIATSADVFEAKFVASNAAGKHTVTYLFEVDEIPSNAVGTFYGLISDDVEGQPHRTGVGSVTFTAGRTGALSAKVLRRQAGTRSFSVKGYDYLGEEAFGVAMTNASGEVFEARLGLDGGLYDTFLVGSAFGGEGKRGTLACYGETNGTFAAVRNAFATSDGNAAAQQVLETYRGTYDAELLQTNGVEEVGTVEYRVNSGGSVYVAARIAATEDDGKRVPRKTLSGSVTGGLVYGSNIGVGGCGAVLRSGTYLWSTEALFDFGNRSVEGAARYIRDTGDTDQKIGK